MKETEKTDYLIIGNSAAGLSAAEAVRKNDVSGKLTVLSNERYFNYSKPLITYFLAGKLSLDEVNFKDRDFYRSNNIILKTSTEITEIDPDKKIAVSPEGRIFKYSKLLIASGGKPIVPQIKISEGAGRKSGPGNYLNKCEGVFTLTTLDDAIALKKYIKENKTKSAVILGGGLIGLKAAEAFLSIGINITIIELAGTILSASFDKTASEILVGRIKKEGSDILTSTTVTSLIISGGRLKKILLSNGRELECDLLVMAIGVKPDTAFMKDAGIETDNGILVNDRMQTNAEGVYSAGDVVKSYDRLSGVFKNIAIWPLAVKQGTIAGRNMSGEDVRYNGGFFMNSVEILGIPVISIGFSSADENGGSGKTPAFAENIEIHKTLNIQSGIYKKIVIKDNRIIGVILLGAIERAGIYSGLITGEIDISEIKENILKDDFGIIQLPEDYRKHLVVGEGIEV